jgi:putative spermidine/putrescine transport system permease protein
VLFFLIFPLLVITPLSFNAVPFFTFTKEMLAFDPAGYSLVWYEEFFTSLNWQGAIRNSVIIAFFSTIIATFLGTLASLGLSRPQMPYRTLLMSLLISPMIVPLIISAAGMFFFYSRIGLQATHLGVILAHAVLGTPFVVITVTATLTGFDNNLIRASQSLGASPTTTFFKIIVPLITPGVISGALFAFVTSFDEVVVVLFVGSYKQRTIPWQMFSGIREQISPTILAAATLLIIVTIALLTTLELLRRRTERLRGVTPS